MIRTYNKIKYTDENGIVTHTLPHDVGSIALCVTNTISGKGYNVKPMRRIVCSCGCVDQYESTIADVICPKCGCVVKYQPNQHSRWGIGRHDFSPFILTEQMYIQDNMIVVPMITINIDGINSEIDIVRNNVAIAEVIQNSGYRLFNFSHDFFKEDNEKLIGLLGQMMQCDSLWKKATYMIDEVVQISQRNGYYGSKSNGFGNGIIGIARLYNVLNLLPWAQTVDTDYLAAIFCFEFQSPVKSLIKSEDDYFAACRVPKFLARVYPICGFPNEPLEYMDQLNDDVEQSDMILPFIQRDTEEFYAMTTITLLLNILRDNNLAAHHEETVKTFVKIICYLNKRSLPFIPQILQSYLKLFDKCLPTVFPFLLNGLAQIMYLIEKNIREHLQFIFTLIENNWNDSTLVSILKLVCEIAKVMHDEFKIYMPQLLSLILQHIFCWLR